MAENQTLRQQVENIDIGKDGKKDGPEYDKLKSALVRDMQTIWMRCQQNPEHIKRSDYDRYFYKFKEILEKNHTSIEAAQARYNQERKIILQETDYKAKGLYNSVRNIVTEISVFSERPQTNDLLHGYTASAGNYTIPVKVFEMKLKTDNFNDLNAKELRSYLEYLLAKGTLSKEMLKQKFWKEKMMDLMTRWSTEVTKFDNKKTRAINEDTTWVKEVRDMMSFKKEKSIEIVLAEILKEELESSTGNIRKAQGLYANNMISKYEASRLAPSEQKQKLEQYTVLIDKAYNAFGKKEYKNKKEFQIKFEKLLESGFSSYDATFKMFGGEPGIKAFQEIMKEVSKIEEKKAQDATEEIQEHIAQNPSCYGKNFCTLSYDKQLEVAEKQNDVKLVELIEKKHKSENGSKRAKTTWGSILATVTAMHNAKNWASLEKINKAVDISTEVIEKQSKIAISTIQSIPGLKDTKDISEIWKNKEKVELVVTYLHAKPQLTKEEREFLELIKLKWQETREFRMAKDNISESEYAVLEKSGKISDFVFAENMIGSIEPNMTLSDLDKKIVETPNHTTSASIKSHTEADNIKTRLVVLKNNEEIFEKIGSGTCSVKKNGETFTLSINGREEVCKSPKEVENTISTYQFFHEMGLKSLIPSMKSFLATVKRSNPLCPDFDIQDGILAGEKQGETLLRAVDTMLNLGMSDKIPAQSIKASMNDFKQRIHLVWEGKIQARLRKRWILNEQGEFSLETLGKILGTKNSTLKIA